MPRYCRPVGPTIPTLWDLDVALEKQEGVPMALFYAVQSADAKKTAAYELSEAAE